MKTLQIGYASDLSYALTLPSYAATAHFHKMLSPELQKKGLQELLAEVEDFAANDYTLALFQGTLLAPERMKEISQRIASYTGLSEHYVEKANLRIDSMRYFKELMRKDGRIVGRFDSRFVIPAGDLVDDITILDPTIISMGGCYASAFLQYLRDDLQWKANAPYYIVNDKISSEWNWTTKSAPAGLGYLNFTDELTQAVVKNPALGVLFANGYYDLATPYMTADYTVAHMIELPASLRNNIEQHYYHAGHMMYVNEPSLAQLKRDLSSFIEKRNGSAFHGIPDTATQVSDLPQSDLPLLSPLQKAEEEMEATSAH
jgi:carboxypeptidase C (cathepsin A)